MFMACPGVVSYHSGIYIAGEIIYDALEMHKAEFPDDSFRELRIHKTGRQVHPFLSALHFPMELTDYCMDMV